MQTTITQDVLLGGKETLLELVYNKTQQPIPQLPKILYRLLRAQKTESQCNSAPVKKNLLHRVAQTAIK